MRLRRPHVASLDQVRITRKYDAAIIEYVEPGVSTTHFKLGRELQRMTDQEILDCFNEMIEAKRAPRRRVQACGDRNPAG